MKFWKVFRFEFDYQVRRPWPWLFVVVLVIFSFLMTRDASLSMMLYTDIFINAPFSIVKTTVFGSLIWLVMAAAIAGDAGARDVATRMYTITYTSPVSKGDYLGGRFLAALVLNAIILLAVQVGILLGVYLPGVAPELIGPFRPGAFLTAYSIIALPNAFTATAIQFGLAARSGRAMGGYAGSFLLIFMGFFLAAMVLYHRSIGALLDPIGVRFIIEDVAHLWTTIEQNRRLLALEGIVLHNRLVWFGIGLLALAITYLSFRFTHRTTSTWWWRRKQKSDATPQTNGIGVTASKPITVPYISRNFGFATHVRQVLVITWASFRTLAVSWGGLVVLVVLPLLSVPVVLDQMESRGIPLVPKTIFVIQELTGSLSDELSRWVIIPFLIVFFAGELVWREREARMGEITDALPGSDWAPFLGKFLGLGLILIVFLAFQIMAGILSQVILGYDDFEIGQYLKIMFGLQLTDYLLFALLALVVHVVVDQKYIGHLVAIIAFVFIAMASLFGIEHNLLIFGASSGWSYTDMRGFGPSLEPWLWFKLYWGAWALLLAVAARLLWVRGNESNLRERLQLARGRFTGATTWTAAVGAGLVLLLGGFIFYNTNVLNDYVTASEMKERQAAYEKRYGKYADRPQPIPTAAKLYVEIYPDQRTVDIRGTYSLTNRSTEAIDSIHMALVPGVETGAIAFSRQAVQVLDDQELHHRVYKLKKPLQPGESLQLNFQVINKPNGFRENGVDASVVENGTYFTNSWLPTIGYKASRELIHASDRREYGLPARPIIASLYDPEARKKQGEGIRFEAVVGTQKNQVAVAPGALRRTWAEDGRRYFHYSTDGPIGGEWGFFSGNYAVHKEQWTDKGSGQTIDIQIFHQPAHATQLERMVQSINASLNYYTQQFGPYEYSHLSFVERPGMGTGMHADASMISYAEGFFHWQPKDDSSDPDVPFAVVAHEMAHQWNVPYANVEGAPVMSESLAWYYAMKVMEKTKGPAHFQQFMSWMHAPYRQEIRRGEPLLRGLDPYMSYRKGPFALYTLSQYVGTEKVNLALRRLVEKHEKKDAPLATTLDLYRELQAVTPDSLQYLLHDLFEVNTNWELEAEQVAAKQTAAGNWEVTLKVQARKLVFDEAGVETEAPMDDWIQVGVFSQDGSSPLYLQPHLIRSGEQTIQVTVSGKPARAGLDPNYLLIDAKPEDNVKEVKLEEAGSIAKPVNQKMNLQNKKEVL
ncbi:M1 family aminopeptidase [Pontibacter locisalis]|uniref:M1 family aminopeptidase n=1 Tax=Pontibacter locisalis TaxID=1719035 RepID=A0ABW5IRI9_9BACT